MTSFESNSKKSGPFFGGFSNSRKRRQDSARKPSARKFLDQFTLEKMEERWMPVITPSYSAGVLTFSFGAASDSMNLTASAVSGANNSFSWTGSFASAGNQTNVSSVIFNDAASATGQQIRFNAGSQVVASLSANGIETFNFNGGNITSTLQLGNAISSFTGGVNSCLTQACVTSGNLTLNTSTLILGTLNASGSNVTVSSSGFGTTVLNQRGGTATVGAVELGTFNGTDGVSSTFRTGSSVGTACLSNGTGSSTLIVNRSATSINLLNISSGTVTMYGTVSTLNQTGGKLTLGFDPDTTFGTSGGKVVTAFNISNATTIVTDNAEIIGVATVNGASNVTIVERSNGTPALKSNFTMNNGTLTIGDNVVLEACDTLTINNGVANFGAVIFDGPVVLNNGSLTMTDGAYGSGLTQTGGLLSANGVLLSSPGAGVAPLAISGGSATVINSTISPGIDDTNAVNITGSASSVNFGNQSSPGNNTFIIDGISTRYFIRNTVPGLSVSALGNQWLNNTTSYDPATQPWDIQNYLLSVQSYSGGLGVSGPIYFNGTNLYVLNNQQGTGINYIQSAIDASLSNGTVNVQGGANVYDEPNLYTQISLNLIGADTGAGLPILRPSGYVDKIFSVYDSMISEVPPNSGNYTTVPTQAFPVAVNLNGFSFDGVSLTNPESAKFVGVNYAYYSGSSFTLGSNVTFSNFSASNSQVLDLQGGLLTVATNNILTAPIHISVTAIDGTLTIASGTTVQGSLNSGTPGTDSNGNPVAQTAIIAGTLAPLFPTDSVTILGGQVNVVAGGLIDNEPVSVLGGNLSVSGGCITKSVSLSAGNLVVSSGNLSGSLTIDGGTTTITGGTFSTVTNELNSITHTISISQGEVSITGATINASYANSTYRDGIYLNAPTTGAVYANLTIGNSSINMGATNNANVAGIRTNGADSTAVGYGNIVLTFNDNLAITGGDQNILINGINTQITGNTFGNITLTDPVNNFIKFENYAFYDQVTNTRTQVYGGNVTYVNSSPSYNFQPLDDFSLANIPTIFNIESKVTDYASSSTVGYVYLYNDKNFVLNGQSIQRVVDTLGTNESVYVQSGTFPESVTVLSSQSGTNLYGSAYYDPTSPNQTVVNPISGSTSAFLIEANSVTIDGFTIDGSNGTTALLHNGSLSGVAYGVTNFDGTSFWPIQSLTLQSNRFNNLTTAGVYLNNNGQDSGASFITSSHFTNIGRTGVQGGIILAGNFYAEMVSNSMSGVTNGIVISDFTNAPTASAAIFDNSIWSYATGITLSNFTGAAAVSLIGMQGFDNVLHYGTGMNATMGSGLTANSIGIYLQGLTGSQLTVIGDNQIDGYAYGYDITNVQQPLTIQGGVITNSSNTGVAVLKNQTFDPIKAAPGVGAYSPNVTVSGLYIISSTTSNAKGFVADGPGVNLVLNGGTHLQDQLSTNAFGARVSNGANLTVANALFTSDGSSTTPTGVINDGGVLTVQAPSLISGFYYGIYQLGAAPQTTVTGGSISSPFVSIGIFTGDLTVSGGAISSQDYGIVVSNSTSTVLIDSTTASTSVQGGITAIYAPLSSSVTVNQSASNVTSITGVRHAIHSLGGDLIVNGGTLTSSSTGNGTILFDSPGTLTVTGSRVQSPGSNGTIGILVSNGSASISGVTLDGNASEGIRFTSIAGNLTITGNGSSPVIAAQDIAVNITASSANISGGQIQASNGVGVSFSSPGTLTFNSNVSATTTGLYLTNGFSNITGGTVSNAANGVLFNGASANGSISGLTFSNNTNDLNLTVTTGGIILGANNVFSASDKYILNKVTSPESPYINTSLGTAYPFVDNNAPNRVMGQSFIATASGILDNIQVYLSKTGSASLVGNLEISLYSATGSASNYRPGVQIGGVHSIPASSVTAGDWYTFSGLTDFNVTAGSAYIFVINGQNITLSTGGVMNDSNHIGWLTSSTIATLNSVQDFNYPTNGWSSGPSMTGQISYVSSPAQDFLVDPSTIFSGTVLSSLSPSNTTQRSTLFGIEDKIVDKIDNSSFGLVRLKPTELFVTTSSFYTPNTSADIQRAIDAASSGYTIFVQNGSYSNNLIVNKNLTIQGEAAANTTIVAASASLPVVNVTSSNVNLSCLTFSGTSSNGIGLFVNNTISGLSVSSSTFSNLSQAIEVGSAGSLTTLGLTAVTMNGNTNGLAVLSGGAVANATLNQIEINNVSGTLFNLAGDVTDLSLTDANGINGGTVFSITGSTSNLTVNTANFSGSVNGLNVGASGSLNNASFTAIDFNNLGGYVGLFDGSVQGLTLFGVSGTNAAGSVLTFNNTTTNVSVTNSNFSNGQANGITLGSNGSLTNILVSVVQMDNLAGWVANLSGPVSNATFNAFSAINAGGSAFTFGSTAGQITLSGVTATNAGGDVLTFASNLTDLTVTNSNFVGSGGNVLALNGLTTNLTVSGSNFSNATGNAFTLASGKSLTNATLTNDQFDYAGGTFANLQGSVSGLTLTNITASHSAGSALTFGSTASGVSLSNVTASNAGGTVLTFEGSATSVSLSGVTATNANGSVLTFNGTTNTDLSVANSNFFGTTGNVLTLNGSVTNLTVSGTNFANATGNAFTLASGMSLTNATLTNDQFDYANGTFANLQGSVSGLTLTNVTASRSGGSALTFGSTASGVSLSNVTASNAGGTVLTFEGSATSVSLTGVTATNSNGSVLTFNGTTNTDLSVTNSNFFGTTGNVLTLNGSVTNLTVSGTNFSNATGNGVTLAAGKVLTNATFSNDQFNNLGGWGANLAGSVAGLSILDSSFNNLGGTALTFSGTASSVNLANLSYVTHTDGIVISSAVTGLTLNNVTLDGSGNGLTVTSAGSVSGLTISGSRFNNGTNGFLAVADTSVSTNQNRLTSVSITGSTFAGNTNYGISLGMLNNAVLSNLTVINNGGSTGGSGGILLNLTNGTFSNITLSNVTATDNGLGGNSTSPGYGVKIGTTNGTLSGLTLTNLSISGNGSTAGSLVGLQLFNNVDLGSTIISGLSVSGANATGLHLTGQSGGQTLNVGNANFDASLSKYIVTESTGTVVSATSATFGGVSAGSGLTPEQAYPIVDKITDSVDESTLGKVVIKSGTVYVTPNSFTTNTSTPSIQRAINDSLTGNTIWIQGNNGTANYTGGVNTSGGKTLTLSSGNSTAATLVNTEGDWTLSPTTMLDVRLGGNTTGSFTQYKLYNQSTSMNLSNAVLAYSNLTGYTPTIGDQFNILNQVGSSTSATGTRLEANITGNMTVLTNGGRYQLASGQYFMSVYEGGSNHNDFVLISAPSQVTNVVVYSDWNNSYLGDPVYYVNSQGSTIQLTYGLTAASNITTGSAQLESTNATMSIANGTYAQVLSKGSLVGNQTYNLIGLSNVSGSFIPDAQQIGNVTVSGISLVPSDTINYRVNGGVFGQFDQLNTNGPIVLGNAVANIAISNTFIAPPSLNSWLPLVNNTHPSAAIGGQFRFANGTQIDTGMPLPIPNDPTHDLYTTYKFGTQAPYNDFALIWSLAPGTQTQVVVDASWAGVEFGAVQAFNGANYTIGLDGFAQMCGYSPVAGTSLVGGVAAVSSNGTITIANGTYNGTFTVNKGFQLVGPTGANQAATFPLATGQTVLLGGANAATTANVSSTNWTGNLRFGNLYVGNGTIFDNVANIVDSNGLLTFDRGVTYANVALSATRSMTIQSNLAGTPVLFSTATGCTALSASGSGVNLILNDITVTGTGTGLNLTNTGTVSFNNVTLNNTLTSPGTINGPTTLNLNYPSSSASNNLTVTMSNLTFTPFGANPVSLLTSNNFILNANIGTTAGTAGNNTISISSNMITAGSLIQTGNGRDAFNISSPAPIVIKAGAGNDTLSMLTAGAYVQSFDGESGSDTLKGGPQSNLFDITGASAGTLYLTQGCATTSTAFTNTEALIGSSLADSFYFTNNASRMSTVNGGLGNDNLNFNGTSGANLSTNYTNQLEFNVNGASAGSVNYFNLGNVTATTPVIDSFVSLENLVGGLSDDVVRMQSTLNGSGAYVSGTIGGSFDGSAGNNTLDYSSYAAGVSVNLTNKSATGIGSASNLRVNNVRDVYGSAYNDVLIGDEKPNILVGNNGNDSLVGNAGNDFLIGSYGTDTLVGGAGWNMDIGGYVDFQGGGNATTAYGIPSQYVDFVLRNLMAQSNWGNVSDATTFNNAANLCESTGVSFYVPGTATQFTNIRLYSGSGNSGPDGTVFDDSQQNSINPGSTAIQAWLFYTTRDTYDGSKVRRASKIWKSFP